MEDEALLPLAISLSIAILMIVGNIIYKDYKLFLSLGRGGVPYNFHGYMTATALRLVALPNTKKPAPIPIRLVGGGYLDLGSLPPRILPRPRVIGIVPHRQIDQRPSKEIFDLLSYRIRTLAKAYPSRLRITTSCFEKHCPALFSLAEANKTCNGEVCHAHPSDGSMHLTLHPEDAQKLIITGWGERHPLARGGWCSRFVPEEFVMVYAPTDSPEVDTVMKIINASVAWVSGSPLPEVPEVDLSQLPAEEKEVFSNDEAMTKIEAAEGNAAHVGKGGDGNCNVVGGD